MTFESAQKRPAIIYDSEFVQALCQPGDFPFGLLTFDIMHAKANGRNAFARQFCQKNGIPLIAVVPKYPCWYPRDDMQVLSRIIRDIAPQTMIAYGASMGGYGALRWGKSCGARAVLACSPQASIDPQSTGVRDRRYAKYFRPDLHLDMDVRPEHLTARNLIIHDPYFRPDAFQASLFSSSNDVHHILAPHMSHRVVGCMTGSGNALGIFGALLEGDMAFIRKSILARRKGNANYYLGIAAHARKSGRYDLAVRIAYIVHGSDPVGYEMLMAGVHLDQRNRTAAAECYLRVLSLKPAHVFARNRLRDIAPDALEDWDERRNALSGLNDDAKAYGLVSERIRSPECQLS